MSESENKANINYEQKETDYRFSIVINFSDSAAKDMAEVIELLLEKVKGKCE